MLVGSNVEVGVCSRQEALAIAEQQGLDLVEISPSTSPPVCKVLDYAKFKYERKRKQKDIKAKGKRVIVKEIKFGPNTDEHDFNFKLRHARGFLEKGAKVRAQVTFRGRAIAFKERGEIVLLKLAQALEDCAKVEQLPKMEGKQMSLIVVPKPSSKKSSLPTQVSSELSPKKP